MHYKILQVWPSSLLSSEILYRFIYAYIIYINKDLSRTTWYYLILRPLTLMLDIAQYLPNILS